MLIRNRLLALAFGSCTMIPLAAQEQLTEHTLTLGENGTMPIAAIDDVGWLAGRWIGEGQGGIMEESWCPPQGRAMVGTVRLIIGGNPSHYELCLISEERGTIMYKAKHFHPDLVGWEERDDYDSYPLVKIEPNAIYFDGLTLKLEGENCIQFLATKQLDGSYQEQQLILTRAECLPANAIADQSTVQGAAGGHSTERHTVKRPSR